MASNSTPTATGAAGLIVLLILRCVEQTPIDNGVEGPPDVLCSSDSMRANFATQKPFHGHVYVKGQFGVPGCHSDFTNSPGDTKISFNIVYATCVVKRERPLNPQGMSMATTVVIQFHHLFLTKVDRAYSLACFYMETIKTVTQALDVSMLPTTDVFISLAMPTCTYTIHQESINGPIVKYSTVGQAVFHKWQCPGGSEYQLLDQRGCSIDPYALGDLTYTQDLTMATREVHVFRFADKMQVSFQCQISLCVKQNDGCSGITPPNCPVVRLPPSPSSHIVPTAPPYTPPPPTAGTHPTAPPIVTVTLPIYLHPERLLSSSSSSPELARLIQAPSTISSIFPVQNGYGGTSAIANQSAESPSERLSLERIPLPTPAIPTNPQPGYGSGTFPNQSASGPSERLSLEPYYAGSFQNIRESPQPSPPSSSTTTNQKPSQLLNPYGAYGSVSSVQQETQGPQGPQGRLSQPIAAPSVNPYGYYGNENAITGSQGPQSGTSSNRTAVIPDSSPYRNYETPRVRSGSQLFEQQQLLPPPPSSYGGSKSLLRRQQDLETVNEVEGANDTVTVPTKRGDKLGNCSNVPVLLRSSPNLTALALTRSKVTSTSPIIASAPEDRKHQRKAAAAVRKGQRLPDDEHNDEDWKDESFKRRDDPSNSASAATATVDVISDDLVVFPTEEKIPVQYWNTFHASNSSPADLALQPSTNFDDCATVAEVNEQQKNHFCVSTWLFYEAILLSLFAFAMILTAALLLQKRYLAKKLRI